MNRLNVIERGGWPVFGDFVSLANRKVIESTESDKYIKSKARNSDVLPAETNARSVDNLCVSSLSDKETFEPSNLI